MTPRIRWRAKYATGLSALLACGACKQSDDIVASGKGPGGAGGALHVETINKCEPGHYAGTMYTETGNGEPNKFPFLADISFRLVETMQGEFSVLQDTAKLVGKATDGSSSSFVADIVAGDSGCGSENTAFTSALENGSYNSTVPFTGTIRGYYHPSTSTDAPPSFSGSWSSTLQFPTGDIMLVGGWFAGLIP